jgi:hypothetical protein
MDSKIQLEENYVRPKPNISFSSLVMIFTITYIFIICITMAFHKKSDTKFIYTNTLNINELLVLIFIVIVLTLFRIADSNLNKDTWKYITKSSSISLQPTTTEPINENSFLRRPWNCHSSVFLSAAGLYIILFVISNKYICVAPYCSLYYGVILFILGLLSYGWWGSNRELLWHMDNRFMEYTAIALAVIFLVSCQCISDNLGLVIISIFIIVRECITNKKLVPGAMEKAFFIVLICAFIMIYFSPCNINRFYLGLALVLVGLLCKSADWMKGYSKGTAFFHFFAALSFYVLWSWSQTVKR